MIKAMFRLMMWLAAVVSTLTGLFAWGAMVMLVVLGFIFRFNQEMWGKLLFQFNTAMFAATNGAVACNSTACFYEGSGMGISYGGYIENPVLPVIALLVAGTCFIGAGLVGSGLLGLKK